MPKSPVLVAGAAALSGGIAIAMLGISPALAGPVSVQGITTHVVTATATAAASSTGEAKATCGSGELLVGGGYVVNSTATTWRIYVDAPLNGKTWLVEPVNFGTKLSFSAYAICAKSAPGKKGLSGYTTKVVQAAVNVPAHQTGQALAACPAGDLLTGGGYDVYNVGRDWSVYSSAPLNNTTWNVQIDNESPATTTFDSFAVCLAKKNGKPVKALANSTVSAAATVPGNSVKVADAACGPKKLMTGGGFEIASIGQNWSIQATAPASPAKWRVRVADLDSFSRNFDSFAVCLAKA